MSITAGTAWNRTFAILTVGIASLALAGCSLLGNITNGTDTETDTGEGTETDVFTVTVGDCLNGVVEGEVSTVEKIDCAEPHDTEAYASIQMDDGDYPGEDGVQAQAETDCTSEFNTFVGIDFDSSVLTFSYYYPTEESWGQGDREIVCLIVDPAGQSTGTLAGAAR